MINEIPGVTQHLALMALDAYAMRHQVLAENIANVSSQSYRPLRLNFEEQLATLQSAVASGAGDQEQMQLAAAIKPFIEDQMNTTPLADRTTRLDQEMALLAQNTLQYEAVITAIGKSGSLLRLAIAGDQP